VTLLIPSAVGLLGSNNLGSASGGLDCEKNKQGPSLRRVGNFYPRAVLTMVKTPVKTGLGKTPKTHIIWAKLGKTNFLNL